MNLVYPPTNRTILSACNAPFFTLNIRLTIPMNTSSNARSPVSLMLLPLFTNSVCFAASECILWRATKFFWWFAVDVCAWSKAFGIDVVNESRTKVAGAVRAGIFTLEFWSYKSRGKKRVSSLINTPCITLTIYLEYMRTARIMTIVSVQVQLT